MPGLYPLKFQYQCKETVWGGTRLSKLGKLIPEGSNCGESWELGAFESFDSVIKNGFLADNTLSEAIEVYMSELVGESVFERFGHTFPLFVKFIDTNDCLSVQVHPDDETSLRRHGKLGKTEAWYVMGAQTNSKISYGFSEELSPEKLMLHIKNNSFQDVIQTKVARIGDFFFLPAGTVHAIGKGITLCEIQQASDITYRLYDYNRPGLDGKPRNLHIEEAIDIIDYSKAKMFSLPYNVVEGGPASLVETDKFTINILEFEKVLNLNYDKIDSFVILICVDGHLGIEYDGGTETLNAGELCLLPAELKHFGLIPDGRCKLLEVYLS